MSEINNWGFLIRRQEFNIGLLQPDGYFIILMIEIPLYSKMYINYVVNFFLEGLDYIVSQGAPPPSLNPRSCILNIVRVSGGHLINCCCFMFTIRRKDIIFF